MTARTRRNEMGGMFRWGHILMLSAWGMVIACASVGFLYVGYLLDEKFGTAPSFMLGLFFLAIVTTVGRLYQEAWRKRKEV